MLRLYSLLFLVTAVKHFCCAETFSTQLPPYPVFPKNYFAKGELRLPYAEIIEPFEAWLDSDNRKSRVDYYDGMTITIQRPDIGKYGAGQKIVFMTTYEQLNVRSCFQSNGTENATLTDVQSVFPNVSECDYKYDGSESYDGESYDVWKCVRTDKSGPDKVNTYRLWMNKDEKPAPFRYEMLGYDEIFGSHYDRYEIIYTSVIELKSVSPDTFEVPKSLNLTCTGFPGPGSQLSLNPIKEYINNDDNNIQQSFENFKEKHKKSYPDEKEHERRQRNFRHNVRYIDSTNRQGLTFTLRVNHLTDWDDDELKILRGRLKYNGEYNGGLPFDSSDFIFYDVPEYLDWRLYGAVNPVKDQATCGSCWSFGTTGTIEGAYFVKSGKLVKLAEQALIDCSWWFGNNGCDGGEDYRAYQWIINSTGIPLAEVYGSYMGQDGMCKDPKTIKVEDKVQIAGYYNISSGDIEGLKLAMFNNGPISVSIDASPKSFSFYSHGVYYNPECKNGPDQLDHSVLAVGFGILGGEKYWLIKNSWSTYWGNDGYILINQKDNNCGVATSATFVYFENVNQL